MANPSWRTPALAVVLGTVLVSCSGGSSSSAPPPCVPACAAKECGPDGCGGSCGSCDDGNACTTDACSAAGACSHQNVADGYTCANLALTGCQDGAEVSVDCRSACKDAGYNVAATCGLGGGDPNLCGCATWATACNASSTACYSSTAQVSCDPAAQLWTVEDCGAYCRSIGYSGSDGCRSEVNFCTCTGTVTIGSGTYPCHGYGGYCTSGSGNYCCAGLSCTWYYNGGNPFDACSATTPCDPQCVQGSVCCGGAFCSGDCIGNPCCS